MSKSDIFCLPSENETFGMVYLEAAANHCAIIGRKYHGIWKNFSDSAIEYVENKRELRRALKQFIINRRMREFFASNALVEVNNFDWSNILQLYKKVYN